MDCLYKKGVVLGCIGIEMLFSLQIFTRNIKQ